MVRLLFAALLLLTTPALAATNFLESAGTGGFIATPFSLQTTELNSLANGGAAISSVGGTSGVFTQSSAGSAIWCSISITFGGAITPTAGGVIDVWFLRSNATGYETAVATPSATVAALPRAPDAIIPLSAAAYASGNVAWVAGGFVKEPWESYYVEVQNLSGATLPSTGNILKCGPTAIQY